MTKDVEPEPFDRATSSSDDVQHPGTQQSEVDDANRLGGSTYGGRSGLERRLLEAKRSWDRAFAVVSRCVLTILGSLLNPSCHSCVAVD